ncbi:tagaturonate reductase [Monaibacterium marinum]|uniref:Tagaturonate reductase n=1 Tax=Pontivivens marinum TaxID=1690039 RepID=A0A2C9CUM6_9RHOB|nr:D-mannonate oxidoreductase [Monaibacterium marinum]SOH94938.1 tagaturonate reductase [Monaibacterium marinum]
MTSPILQFGTSRFLQAHADLFLSQAMAQGQDVGPITVVQSSGDATRATRLSGLVGAYPVRVEGVQNGTEIRQTITVTSIARTLSTALNWADVVQTFTNDTKIVLSNTGDSGFTPQPADSADSFDQSMSYPAKLTLLLRARLAAGGAPIQIMPMELIVDNGAVLKRRVLELAQGDAALIRYIEQDVIWVNSLVDRIVSQPLEPAGAVAEPYALWAIEDQPRLTLPCVHPAVQVVKSLAQIEALKLFVLNLGHTYLADNWLAQQGPDSILVRDLMADPDTVAALRTMLQTEVRPAFAAAGLATEFDAYVPTTLDRFANPFLDHRIADIAQNHQQKITRRIAAMCDWAAEQGDTSPKPTLSAIIARNKDLT